VVKSITKPITFTRTPRVAIVIVIIIHLGSSRHESRKYQATIQPSTFFIILSGLLMVAPILCQLNHNPFSAGACETPILV
jgi:hypothetical protein